MPNWDFVSIWESACGLKTRWINNCKFCANALSVFYSNDNESIEALAVILDSIVITKTKRVHAANTDVALDCVLAISSFQSARNCSY